MQIQHYPFISSADQAEAISSPIVLFNGWSMSSDSWGDLLSQLQGLANVVVVDMDYQQAIGQQCQTMVDQLAPESILFGWSLGAMLATRIALDYPERVKALICLAGNLQFVANEQWPTAMPKDTFDGFYQAYEQAPAVTLKRFFGLIAKGSANVREQKRFLQSLDSAKAPEASALKGLDLLASMSHVESITELACPALHIYGEHDQLVPVAAAQRIEQKLSAMDNQQVVIVSGASHLLHYPDEHIKPLLVDFVRGIHAE